MRKIEITLHEYVAMRKEFPNMGTFGCATFMPGDWHFPEGYILTEWGHRGDIKPFVSYEKWGNVEKFYRFYYAPEAI